MTLLRHLPHHRVNIFGLSFIVVGIVGLGTLISLALPADAPGWLAVSCYLAPASIAFVVHWWLDQDA